MNKIYPYRYQPHDHYVQTELERRLVSLTVPPGDGNTHAQPPINKEDSQLHLVEDIEKKDDVEGKRKTRDYNYAEKREEIIPEYTNSIAKFLGERFWDRFFGKDTRVVERTWERVIGSEQETTLPPERIRAHNFTWLMSKVGEFIIDGFHATINALFRTKLGSLQSQKARIFEKLRNPNLESEEHSVLEDKLTLINKKIKVFKENQSGHLPLKLKIQRMQRRLEMIFNRLDYNKTFSAETPWERTVQYRPLKPKVFNMDQEKDAKVTEHIENYSSVRTPALQASLEKEPDISPEILDEIESLKTNFDRCKQQASGSKQNPELENQMMITEEAFRYIDLVILREKYKITLANI
jgi:hypothetical protein